LKKPSQNGLVEWLKVGVSPDFKLQYKKQKDPERESAKKTRNRWIKPIPSILEMLFFEFIGPF
jgi:hypothetical protein